VSRLLAASKDHNEVCARGFVQYSLKHPGSANEQDTSKAILIVTFGAERREICCH